MTDARRVVLDTNVLVAAGFSSRSASAALVEAVERGDLTLVWDDRTHDETHRVVTRIPPLDWSRFEDLYDEAHRWEGGTHPERFEAVGDPTDRKFAALACAADATLVSNDDDLLSVRERIDARVATPSEARERLGV